MQTTETKFIVGQEYYYRFSCDWDTKSYMTVVSRTEKTAMILERHESEPVRRNIHVRDGVESISAGNYSMAGSWYANRQDESEAVIPAVPEVEETPEPSNLIAFPVKAPVEVAKVMSPVDARVQADKARKLLLEALEALGRGTEVDMVSAILDRDHYKLLEILRGMAAGIRAGGF